MVSLMVTAQRLTQTLESDLRCPSLAVWCERVTERGFSAFGIATQEES